MGWIHRCNAKGPYRINFGSVSANQNEVSPVLNLIRMSNVAFVTTVTILVTVTQNGELTTLNVHTIFPTHIRTYHMPFLDMLQYL